MRVLMLIAVVGCLVLGSALLPTRPAEAASGLEVPATCTIGNPAFLKGPLTLQKPASGQPQRNFVCKAKGDWLDITDRVFTQGGGVHPGAPLSIKGKGGGPFHPYCEVNVTLHPTAPTGRYRVIMERPGNLGRGRDSNSFDVTIVE